MKKNANESVDFEKEKKNDPKYKTELCKSWIDTKFCIYGNKCRFAHGKDEVSNKPINNTKYKLKKCTSFFERGFCQYGNRCHFKHDERNLDDIYIPYFGLSLPAQIDSETRTNNLIKTKESRLKVFEKFCNSNEEKQDSKKVIQEIEKPIMSFIPMNKSSITPATKPVMKDPQVQQGLKPNNMNNTNNSNNYQQKLEKKGTGLINELLKANLSNLSNFENINKNMQNYPVYQNYPPNGYYYYNVHQLQSTVYA